MRIEKADAGYRDKTVLNDVNIEVAKGEIISLIGPNGGGKSTLLKCISGSLKLKAGTVYIDRDDISTLTPVQIAKRLSVVTTERIRPQLMTAMDVVLSGRLPYTDGFGRMKKEDKDEAAKAMELTDTKHLSDKPYMDLSDGQKQRVLIARAICQTPEYLIMDEPTSYMDIRHRYKLMDVIRELASTGISVIMSLHEIELALDVSDRLMLIYDDGHSVCATPKEVIKDGLLKKLYGLDDDMYKKISLQISGIGTDDAKCEDTDEQGHKIRHSMGFANVKCEYFPCHDVDKEKFNCMFCYCPLYEDEECGGEFFINDKGVKNCRNCSYPHDIDNYPEMIRKIKDRMYDRS